MTSKKYDLSTGDTPDKHEAWQLPSVQREALVDASTRDPEHPVAKGFKAQHAALVKKGALDEEFNITARGVALVAHLSAPLDFRTGGGLPKHRGGASASPIGVYSNDRQTIYVTQHGKRSPAVAYIAASVPEYALRILGLIK